MLIKVTPEAVWGECGARSSYRDMGQMKQHINSNSKRSRSHRAGAIKDSSFLLCSCLCFGEWKQNSHPDKKLLQSYISPLLGVSASYIINAALVIFSVLELCFPCFLKLPDSSWVYINHTCWEKVSSCRVFISLAQFWPLFVSLCFSLTAHEHRRGVKRSSTSPEPRRGARKHTWYGCVLLRGLQTLPPLLPWNLSPPWFILSIW